MTVPASYAEKVARLSLEPPAERRRGESEADDETVVRIAPEAPGEAAYYGLAGEIVRAIEPHSEADPVAILAQLLVAVGSTLNRGPHYLVESDEHCLNLYCLLVGSTSSGRKGTSWGRVRSLMREADDLWARRRVVSGLSSGEGLIWEVRDPITRETAKGTETVDPGVTDKRLCVIETEFGRALKTLGREGNTLSAVLRQAWETGDLAALTKNATARATGAHISLIGHITPEELRRQLDAVEVANGLLNRFLLLYVRRSKFLPEGGDLDVRSLSSLIAQLRKVIDLGRTAGRLRRDEACRERWAEIYPELTTGRPGPLGAVTSRAAAQVTRLSCLYAILDGERIVRVPHLEAALALWRYCEDSARYVLGESLGDPVADEIVELLRQRPDGMTRTEIRDHFQRHLSRQQIATALGLLYGQGLVDVLKESTGGRPRERWRIRLPSQTSLPSPGPSENEGGQASAPGEGVRKISDVSDRSREKREREREEREIKRDLGRPSVSDEQQFPPDSLDLLVEIDERFGLQEF